MSTPNKVILGEGSAGEPSRESIHIPPEKEHPRLKKDPKGRGIVQCENTPKKERLLHLKITQLERKPSEPTFTFGNLQGCTKLSEKRGYYITNPNKALYFGQIPRLIPQNK